MSLRLWLLVLLVCASAFAPSRADARAAETRTWVFLPQTVETRLADEPQAAGTHQENGLFHYEHAPGCTQQAKSETGSYTNYHESGMTYNGKGNKKRSQTSAQRVEAETGDRHVATEWTPAANEREAFKQESRRLDSHGGATSQGNHNKIESPGKKMREQDNDY